LYIGFYSFPIKKRVCREGAEKEHGTLISTYLITQIKFQCLIIRGRRVFFLSIIC